MPTPITEGPRRLTTPESLRRWSLHCHAAGMTVGLVPTMGALHAGHRSLVNRALDECDRVVVSIFVNPLQFGPGEDFERYPRPLEDDLRLLAEAGAHAVYMPSPAAMYPEPPRVRVRVEAELGSVLEGAHRPNHFDGVAMVVAKLFISSRADRAYFGLKDAQQSVVVRAVARDLDTGTEIVVCPVVRDHDGLAFSSRNRYLSDADRSRARAIPGGIAAAAAAFDAGERSVDALTGAVCRCLETAGAAIDYVAVVAPESVAAVEKAEPGCRILVAAKIGTTRLIDAFRLGVDAPPAVRAFD